MADELLSGQISFTGLGSGTDFQTMIDKLIEIEGNHKTQLENWRTSWENKITALQEINSSMLTLRTTLGSMDTMNEFLSKSVSSSASTYLTATADSEAEIGTHSIIINQLAKNAILTNSNGESETDTQITAAAANFAYNYQGTEYVVAVAGGTTLEGLQNLINSDPDNPGVRASIVSDGSEYFLQLRGLDLGSDADLVISSNSTLADYTDSGDFETSQLNRDSQIRVDGWPLPTASNAWIQSDSNTVSGVIPGVTLNLKGVSSPSEIQISITTDTDAIKENIQTFVSQVNEVRTMIMSLTEFDSSEQEGSIMTGNYAVQLVDSNLKYAIANLGVGFLHYDATNNTGDKYSALSQLGILTEAQEGSVYEGLLVIDEETLDEVLADDPQAVAELFAADHVGDQVVTSATGNFSYYSHISSLTKAGTYDVTYQLDGSGNIISNTAYIGGVKALVDNTANTITSAGGDSKGMVIKVNDFTPGSSVTGKVRLKQGKAGEIGDLLDSLTNEQSGPLYILEDNYEDIIDNIDEKIEYEEAKLIRMRSDLVEKYARLEALLGEYEGISDSLSNQISQLSDS